jgi:hypothetical protein
MLHGEHGKLLTRSEVLWRKGFNTAEKQAKIAATLWQALGRQLSSPVRSAGYEPSI